MSKKMERLDEFVAISERLTGYSRTELVGTGSAQQYLTTLDQAVPRAVLDQLFDAARAATSDDAFASQVVSDTALGPIARNIIVLWYSGTWHELDAGWLRAHNGSAVATHVVSANAYLSGLQWKVARAHAPGGNMQGFGAWARAPEGEAS